MLTLPREIESMDCRKQGLEENRNKRKRIFEIIEKSEEGDKISSVYDFFDAIYWATVSLTTVGYGDIYPVTTLGRIITMISSVFGIAIVALPAGIITAGYMSEVQSQTELEEHSKTGQNKANNVGKGCN